MQATVHGVVKSRTRLSDFTFTFTLGTKIPRAVEQPSPHTTAGKLQRKIPHDTTEILHAPAKT